MHPCLASSRRGITLMEVLISIGILAIGLSSVVALVPAGRSEAAKAVVLDRGAALAMNALNDAVTFGLTRPGSFVSAPAARLVTFDDLEITTGSNVWSGTVPNASSPGQMRQDGVLSSSTATPASSLLYPIIQGRDDLGYTAPANDEAPPTNLFTTGTGTRQFQGRTTALLSIAASGTSPTAALTPGSLAKVTAVVFHNRVAASVADAIVTGTYNDPSQPAGTIVIPATAVPADRTLKEILRPGTVVYSAAAQPDSRWFQVAMASVDESTGLAYVTFVGDAQPSAGAAVQIALDSVGLAERIVTLEGSGPYGQ
jgi:type II secretory pathway pseudopilin PulG